MKWPYVSAVLLVVTTAALWYVSRAAEPESISNEITGSTATVIADELAIESRSPFSLNEPDAPDSASVPEHNSQSVSGSEDFFQTVYSQPAQELPPLDAPLSDEQFDELVKLLKTSPALLQQLIDEFRQETDPERKKRLAQILGEVGGDQALLLASEQIFSGDTASRTLGLSLLQAVQPGNAQARDIVSNMLATEVEPNVLIGALTALAKPGDVDSPSRAYLSDQVAWLTSHPDDGVRSISLDILSRWSNDGSYTDVLVAGLDDASEYVRTSAAYALASHEDKSPVVVESLFVTLRNSTEPKSVKGAAIYALRAMPLTAAQTTELDVLELELNTVRR